MTHIWKSPGSDLEVPRLPNERDIAREEHLGVGVVHGGGGAQLLLLHLDLLLHLLAVRVEGDVAADLVWKQLVTPQTSFNNDDNIEPLRKHD